MKLISIQLPDTKFCSTVEFFLLCVLYKIQIAVSACTCWISIFCGKIKVACQNLTAANLTCQYGKHSYSLFVWLKSKSKARYKCVKRRSFVCQQLASNSCRVDCFLYFLLFFFFVLDVNENSTSSQPCQVLPLKGRQLSEPCLLWVLVFVARCLCLLNYYYLLAHLREG